MSSPQSVSRSPTTSSSSCPDWSNLSGEPASRRIRSSSNTSAMEDPPEDHRTVVRDELDPIPEVTVEFMLQHIVPDSNVDVNATMTKLQETGIWSEEIGWKAFEGETPKVLARKKSALNGIENADTEIQILSRMKDIYECIISCSIFHHRFSQEPTLKFENLPKSSPVLDPAVNTRPHSFGALRPEQDIHTMHLNIPPTPNDERNPQAPLKSDLQQSAFRDFSRPTWFDVACVGGYKADDRTQDLNENVLNMVWSLHHIMQIDHRRRFSFGITVENEDTRVWFACRQIVMVTRPFNLSRNAPQLVQLVASLAYATPVQLGYDPTMKLQWRDDNFYYDIECTTKRRDGSEQTALYKTKKVLSDTAYNLRGRATRVYLAMASDEDNTSVSDRLVVLKDSWLDVDRPKEGDTLSKLLEGASEEQKRLFLTVYQRGIVQIEDQDDSTQGLILKGRKIGISDDRVSNKTWHYNPYIQKLNEENGVEYSGPMQEQVEPDQEIRTFHLYTPVPVSSVSQTSTSDFQGIRVHSKHTLRHRTRLFSKEPTKYSPKIHYRIAFTDVGESLERLTDSGKTTIRILDQVIHDITKALKYMATKGYVHRDISPGNILWFGDHAKLSDLEFAQEYGTGGSSDARTGTFKFMAGEVMAGRYSVKEYDAQYLKVPFIYNPIHDLESLWWVGVWGTMCHYPAPFDKIEHSEYPSIKYNYRDFNSTERAHLNIVRGQAEILFPSDRVWSPESRMKEIHDKWRYGRRVGGDYPMFFHAFTFGLHSIRQCISWAYKEIQNGNPRTEASYFTDVLRVGNPCHPLLPGDKNSESVQMSVHDMILQMLAKSRNLTEVEDIILLPLQSVDQYSKFLADHKTEKNSSPAEHRSV